jgi:hypothetical protein
MVAESQCFLEREDQIRWRGTMTPDKSSAAKCLFVEQSGVPSGLRDWVQKNQPVLERRDSGRISHLIEYD